MSGVVSGVIPGTTGEYDTENTGRIVAVPSIDENGNAVYLLGVSVNGLGMVNNAAYNQSNLVSGAIVFGAGIVNRGLDIYNDSTSNTLTFTLNNGTNTVFTFTLQPGQSLINQIYSPFTEIVISGTTPIFRAITRN